MSHAQAVLHEIMAFEKLNGRKPELLVLCDKEFKEKFFSDLIQLTWKDERLDFKQPGYFYGVQVVWKNIWQYQGSCGWMLVGGETK